MGVRPLGELDQEVGEPLPEEAQPQPEPEVQEPEPEPEQEAQPEAEPEPEPEQVNGKEIDSDWEPDEPVVEVPREIVLQVLRAIYTDKLPLACKLWDALVDEVKLLVSGSQIIKYQMTGIRMSPTKSKGIPKTPDKVERDLEFAVDTTSMFIAHLLSLKEVKINGKTYVFDSPERFLEHFQKNAEGARQRSATVKRTTTPSSKSKVSKKQKKHPKQSAQRAAPDSDEDEEEEFHDGSSKDFDDGSMFESSTESEDDRDGPSRLGISQEQFNEALRNSARTFSPGHPLIDTANQFAVGNQIAAISYERQRQLEEASRKFFGCVTAVITDIVTQSSGAHISMLYQSAGNQAKLTRDLHAAREVIQSLKDRLKEHGDDLDDDDEY